MSYDDKIVLTGIKPTGTPHLGNLVGAIWPVINMSKEAKRSFVFIADLHALNAEKDPKAIKQSTYEVAASFIALGLDTEKTAFYRQSDIPEDFQLAMFLMNVTGKGLMNRGHAYKAMLDKNAEKGNEPDDGVNMGLFTYPILMAADILLYGAECIPVGADQKQHVEFARDIAGSFNHIYGREILTMPEPIIPEAANAVPGFDGRKMSKSYGNTIPIFAESNALKKLCMKIVTDSARPEDKKNPDDSAIFQLYLSFASDEEIAALRARFQQGGLSYGDAKTMLYEAIDAKLAEPRERYKELMANPGQLDEILEQGAERARFSAKKTLEKVSKAMLGRSIIKT